MMGRDLLGIEDLERADLERILETAERMQEVGRRDVKKVPTLRGRTLVNLFFESSTRTRTSFEIAGKRLSADVVNFSPSSSSLKPPAPMPPTNRPCRSCTVASSSTLSTWLASTNSYGRPHCSASSTPSVASMISGPMPSPRITAMVWVMASWFAAGLALARWERRVTADYPATGPVRPAGRQRPLRASNRVRIRVDRGNPPRAAGAGW